MLNLGSAPKQFVLPDGVEAGRILLSTWLDQEGALVRDVAELRADEGLIAELF
jgi:hypothetical protein